MATSYSRGSWTVICCFTLFASLAGGAQQEGEEVEESLDCIPGTTGAFPGMTIPRGDIFLKEHDNLELYCKINLTNPAAKGLNASFIDFKFYKTGILPDQMEKTVINASTAVVRVRNMNASEYHAACELRKPTGGSLPVCLNNVYVGYPPKKVEGFRCVSDEWKILNCTWKNPENPVKTRYAISHMLHRYQHVDCPPNRTKPDSCSWDGSTDPPYRFALDPLYFRINGTNKLKPEGIIWDFKFTLGSIIIPEKPIIHVAKLSPVQYQVNWTFESYEYFKYGLDHHLRVCHLEEGTSKCSDSYNKTIPVGNRLKMTPFIVKNLTLGLGNTNYSISIRIRSQAANDTAEFWSKPGIYNITTEARPPDSSPNADNSSFDSQGATDFRDVNIYWASIPEHKKNGPDFNYSISVYENKVNLLNITPDSLAESFATFKKLRSASSYHFFVTAVNRVGSSWNATEIIVPSVANLPPEPQSVAKTDFTNGSFDISWRIPVARKNKSEIVSYTVFRCPSPRTFSCEGRLEWDRVPVSNQTEMMHMFYDKVDSNYQFAVSANTIKHGSGMIWASCNLVHGRGPGKLQTVKAEDTTESEVVITWALGCAYRPGDIEGFEISYCRVDDNLQDKCTDESKSTAVEGANHTTYKLVNLQPFSIYMISVLILANNEVKSPPSDSIYARTLEGPPGPVRDVSVVNVTKSEAVLRITSPLKWNGVLREFRVVYGSGRGDKMETKVQLNLSNSHGRTPKSFTREVTLGKLKSNTNFTAYVVACTTNNKCGVKSSDVYFSTEVAATNLSSFPRISWALNGNMLLEWDAPATYQNPVSEFEILLKRNGETDEEPYPSEEYHEGLPVYSKQLPKACEPSTNFTAQVRAVTRLGRETLYGDWSPPGNYYCGGTAGWIVWVILFVVALMALTFFGYLSFRGYSYFRRMKDGLAIKLPPGLNSELNGFTHKPPPRSRSHENGKEMCAYPLQPAGASCEESKDFLSSSDHNQGEAEDSLIEKPYCPSPSNPLLGGIEYTTSISTSNGGGIVLTGGSSSGCGVLASSSPHHLQHLDDSDSSDIRLADFSSLPPDRCSSPTAYKKVGVQPNGSAVLLDSPDPSIHSSTESTISPSHSHLPPDVLTQSSPTNTSSLSPIFSRPPPQTPPAAVAAPPAPSSSYVKWTTFVPDMKTGEAPHESRPRQSPYCQVGILLDS